jgi:hypothetical protein
MRKLSLAVALLLCLTAASNAFTNTIQDSINPSLTPAPNSTWSANYVAWVYMAGNSYTLTDLETKWGTLGNSGTVGVALYSGFSTGPTGLLGSSTMFANNNNSWSTSTFSPIAITAGTTYYIDFSGAMNLSANFNATGPGTLTSYYFSDDGSNWGLGSLQVYGIFQFGGTQTPEPGSMVLLGSGLLGAAGMIRRRLSK